MCKWWGCTIIGSSSQKYTCVFPLKSAICPPMASGADPPHWFCAWVLLCSQEPARSPVLGTWLSDFMSPTPCLGQVSRKCWSRGDLGLVLASLPQALAWWPETGTSTWDPGTHHRLHFWCPTTMECVCGVCGVCTGRHGGKAWPLPWRCPQPRGANRWLKWRPWYRHPGQPNMLPLPPWTFPPDAHQHKSNLLFSS